MHTENTLQLLEATTATLAHQCNVFTEVTCTAYQTTETSKEYTARLRRASKAVKSAESSTPITSPFVPVEASSSVPGQPSLSVPGQPSSSIPGQPSSVEQSPSSSAPIAVSPGPKAFVKGRLTKTFNLNTYKYHALADYASTIRAFGTTDSYSTERVRGLQFDSTFSKTDTSLHSRRASWNISYRNHGIFAPIRRPTASSLHGLSGGGQIFGRSRSKTQGIILLVLLLLCRRQTLVHFRRGVTESPSRRADTNLLQTMSPSQITGTILHSRCDSDDDSASMTRMLIGS
jgi:hypothetical protein